MDYLIKAALKKHNAVAVIRRQKVESYIIIDLIDVLTKDNKYVSFTLIHNGFFAYSKETLFLNNISGGEYFKDLVDLLDVKVYKDKQDYLTNKESLPSKKIVDRLIDGYREYIYSNILNICTENFTINNCSLLFTPKMLVVLSYSFKGNLQEPLMLILNGPSAVAQYYNDDYSYEYEKWIEKIAKLIGGLIIWYEN